MYYYLLTQLIFRGGMQGQPLSTHYVIKIDSQTSLMCVVKNIQLEKALKWLSFRPRVWSEKEVTIG